MRLFLNMLYDFPKNTKLSEMFAKLQQVLAENQWEQQRILFNFHDINDAATESRTPNELDCDFQQVGTGRLGCGILVLWNGF